MQGLLSMAKSVGAKTAPAQAVPEPTSELMGKTFPIAKQTMLRKFVLFRQVPKWCAPPSHVAAPALRFILCRPTEVVPGEAEIRALLPPLKRVSFKGSVIVEDKQGGAWTADPMVHTSALSATASLGDIDLPCALLAPAEGANAVAWLSAPPIPSGTAVADTVLRTMLDTHFPVMLVSGAHRL